MSYQLPQFENIRRRNWRKNTCRNFDGRRHLVQGSIKLFEWVIGKISTKMHTRRSKWLMVQSVNDPSRPTQAIFIDVTDTGKGDCLACEERCVPPRLLTKARMGTWPIAGAGDYSEYHHGKLLQRNPTRKRNDVSNSVESMTHRLQKNQ